MRILNRFYRVVQNDFKVPILTPQLSKQKWQKLELENGIKALVISDPESPHTSAALSIEAGSWNDGIPGSAHFLEHLLFLGTSKYPDEFDYERFIYDANGVLNGYTANDHSMYYFSRLNPSKFAGALDRFSRFFYEPLFSKNCVGRERIAVDEEYKKNITSDGWRVLHVRKELADQSHPFSGFNTGNLETMKKIDHDYLVNWFNKYYSSNLMHLVMVGTDPVEKLAQDANQYFLPIPNRHLTVPQYKTIFPNALHGRVVWIKPFKDLKQLQLSWELPESMFNMNTHAHTIVNHLIGREGKGSILSDLKARGLVENLSVGDVPLGSNNFTFEISCTLTDAGQREWMTVRQLLLESLQTLAQSPIQQYVVDELNYMTKISFEYQQRSPSLATYYCGMLRKEALETFPKKSLFISDFEPEKTREFLKALNPSTCMTYLIAPKQDGFEFKEKWMGAEYSVMDLPTISNVGQVPVTTPSPNPFVPDKLNLVATEPTPKLIYDQHDQLYVMGDDQFRVPEISFKLNIKSTQIQPGDATSQALTYLLLHGVQEQLTETLDEAQFAGLNCSFSMYKGVGIQLSLKGYSQKASVFLEKVLKTLTCLELNQQDFDIWKSSLLRRFKNFEKEAAVRQAYEAFSNTLYHHHVTQKQLSKAMETVTLDQLLEFSNKVFNERLIQGFVGGNIQQSQALDLFEMARSFIKGTPCDASLVEPSPIHSITSPTFESINVIDGNACVLGIRAGLKSTRERVLIQVFAQLLKEPFYTELRTRQQTGYIVDSHFQEYDKELFLMTHIQSNTFHPRDLLARKELFLEHFISNDFKDRLGSIKTSLLNQWENPFDQLSAKVAFYHHVAFEEQGTFDILSKRIDFLKQLNESHVKEYAEICKFQNNRLAILACGQHSFLHYKEGFGRNSSTKNSTKSCSIKS